jgi:cytochrome c oxidase assembly protein subunit 15
MAHREVDTRGRLAARVDFPRLVAATSAMLLLTVLMGVATKATGSGLACHARWPVCDGGFLNLFPRSFPSYFEWLHRLVAGVAGLAIVATVTLAWLRDVPARSRGLVTFGLVLLPVQMLLGRETVLSFTAPVLALHFWTAFAIFASFVAATALTWRSRVTPHRLRDAVGGAALLVPLQVVLHPPFVTGFTPPVQTAQYLVTFLTFALVLSVAVAGRDALQGPWALAPPALAGLPPQVVLDGRPRFAPGPASRAAYLGLATVLFAGLAATTVALHRAASR